jgi:hypothetical protein
MARLVQKLAANIFSFLRAAKNNVARERNLQFELGKFNKENRNA